MSMVPDGVGKHVIDMLHDPDNPGLWVPGLAEM